MVKRSNLLISVFVSYLTTQNDVNGFSTVPAIDGNRAKNDVAGGGITRTMNSRTPTYLNVISSFSSGNYFFDDFSGGGSDDDDSSSSSQHPQNHVQHESSSGSNNSDSDDIKFVTGDDLHRLRHQVLAMRLELQEARREAEDEDEETEYSSSPSSSSINRKVYELERSIMKTQQVDAEFVYTVSLERKELAEQDGNMFDAQRYHELAMEARSALPQFDLEGLWVGKYGDQEYEMINITYAGDTLLAHKVTSGTKHVPRGAETFRVDLSPQLGIKNNNNEPLNNSNRYNNNNNNRQQQQQYQQQQNNDAAPQVLSPIELGDSAAKQWGCKYLQRFAGIGQVASEGYQDSQWMDGQLILVNEYFSFAWLPIGHQVFFGRPTPELILKLMKDEKKKEHTSGARSFLEKCWEETEHIEDDMEIDCNIDDITYDTTTTSATTSATTNTNTADSNCYYQEGCWE
ncbi:MAG: hypothetical protein ACI8RD_000885 [Bacillariaceae sp.]|jgi:hypothetical protein